MSKSPTGKTGQEHTEQTITDQKPEHQQPTFINARRRGFLQSAAVVSAGASVGAGAAVAGELTQAAEPTTESLKHRGYQETEHVREYYRKARS